MKLTGLFVVSLAALLAACMPSGNRQPLESASIPHVDPLGAAPHSHGPAEYGEPGNPDLPSRSIEISMSETSDGRMVFVPDRIDAQAGDQVTFRIQNHGELTHEFVLATTEANIKHGQEMEKNPDMEHDDPNAVRLNAGEAGDITWRFTKSGTFEFACLIPGHREAGMIGLAAVN